ncbi:MAG: host-nuclease inhibitor Gam family protein [Ignavibacterium album]|uniref:host-nuclease inhibitor Gam family protein n=1 Tax=Ignavibacterium album TaxID=591197 RepID=UPI0026F223E2|nr:host-nuclease inhibitor Gam family protein [Ignavibacterium album]MCX8106746.1 host-nuclease inhibitor Gam family protein [Ignavibacterium album]
MTEEQSFIEELLKEAEEKELQMTKSLVDLLLIEIGKLNEQIKSVQSEAEEEINIINQWAQRKVSKLIDRISFFEARLERFIREQGVKTIELPNGTLKIRKSPDKVEIADTQLFMNNATPELLRVIPESVKPDLIKIKSFIRLKGTIPPGVKYEEGKEKFTYKLTNKGDQQ